MPPTPEIKSEAPRNFKSAVLRVISDPKNLPAIIVSVASLVTAITSLVKALDTTIAQASYETLAKQVTALQDRQEQMWQIVQTASSAEPPQVTVFAPLASASAASPQHPPVTGQPYTAGQPLTVHLPQGSGAGGMALMATPSAEPPVVVMVEPRESPIAAAAKQAPMADVPPLPSFEQVKATAAE